MYSKSTFDMLVLARHWPGSALWLEVAGSVLSVLFSLVQETGEPWP